MKPRKRKISWLSSDLANNSTLTSQTRKISSSSASALFAKNISPPPKSPRTLTGELSPLHTRRRYLHESAIVSPDFAVFDYHQQCPQLFALLHNDLCFSVGFNELDKLQCELEQLLVHTTDHQKKICGELTYQLTGEYPCDDISSRPMPSYQLKPAMEPVPGCSKNNEDPIIEDPTEVDYSDEGFDIWPPVNLPQKFWTFIRDFSDPIDDEYIRHWYHDIYQAFSVEAFRKLYSSGKKFNLENGNRDEKNYSKVLSLNREKSSLSSNGPPKISPLIEEATNACFVEEQINFPKQVNGLSPECKKAIRRKDNILNGGKNEKKKEKRKLKMEESHDNNQQNGASLNEQVVERDLLQNNIIDQFGRSLGDYLAKVELFSKKETTSVDFSDERSCTVEDCVKEEMRETDEENTDEVTSALHKAQKALMMKEKTWRPVVIKLWHRLLAEYLRNKMENELDKADKELFEVYEKYYNDYPRHRPNNDLEKDECYAALHRRNSIAKAYYNRKYIDITRWILSRR